MPRGLRWVRHLDFRRDLLTILAVLIAVLGVGGAALFHVDIRDKQAQTVALVMARDDLRARQLAQAVALQTTALLRLADVALRQLANVYIDEPETYARVAEATLRSLPENAAIRILFVNANGLTGDATDHAPPGTWVGDRPYFSYHADGGADRLYVDDPIQPRIGGGWAIPLSRPVRNGNKFLGVVTLSLRPEYLSAQIGAPALNAGDIVALVKQRDGTFLARNHALAEALGHRIPADRPMLSPGHTDNENFRAESVVDHTIVDFAWQHLEEWPLIAVVALDEEEELAPLVALSQQTRARGYVIEAGIAGLALALACILLWARRQQRKLALNQQMLQATFDHAAAGILNVDLAGQILACNARICEITGYSAEELLERRVQDITVPDDVARSVRQLELLRAGAQSGLIFDKSYRCKSGETVPVRLTTAVIRDHDGTALRFVTLVEDRTAQQEAEQERQLAAEVFFNAHEGIVITDAQNRIIRVNDAFERITGYGHDEVLGRNPALLQSGRHKPEFYAAMWFRIVKEGYWNGEIWNRRRDGEVYPQMLSISAVRDDAGRIRNLIGLFSDISRIKENEERLKFLAHFDMLTGLPNRLLMLDRLAQALRQQHRHAGLGAVLFLDLDGFKAVNDTYGHDIGDEVLVVIAKRLNACLRASDTLARIGGDEFVAIIDEIAGPADFEPVLERLLAAVAEPMRLRDGLVRLSVSIGVAVFPDDGEDAEQLLRRADQAMYAAKESGKNRYHFFNQIQDERARRRRQEIERMRLGLERGEFTLHYQPQIDMRSRHVFGMEALIRWEHPENGLLLPAAFLPALADDSFSIALGNWVVAAAVAQLRRWRDAGLELRVAINVSPQHLESAEFLPHLLAVLEAHPDLPRNAVELEILETASLEDVAKVADVIRQCHAIGLRIAMDDFGTGYASLTYLRQLPIDCIKIDRSFVIGMPG